jgi:hypothetical protein
MDVLLTAFNSCNEIIGSVTSISLKTDSLIYLVLNSDIESQF